MESSLKSVNRCFGKQAGEIAIFRRFKSLGVANLEKAVFLSSGLGVSMGMVGGRGLDVGYFGEHENYLKIQTTHFPTEHHVLCATTKAFRAMKGGAKSNVHAVARYMVYNFIAHYSLEKSLFLNLQNKN